MAFEISLITQAIGAAGSAVGLVDKIADQIERFVTKAPEPGVPKQHRVEIQGEGDRLVARTHGQIVQTITADDLKALPENELRHITVLERSMENHYRIWASVYPQLAVMDSPVQKAKVEQQLQDVLRGMKGDLEGIFSFLESSGLHLDDHYMHIRHLVAQA